MQSEKPQMTGWPTKLLAVSSDAKTVKGEKRGHLSGIMYLAQGDLSGYEVCAGRTPACFGECLGGKGRAESYTSIGESRINKTIMFFEHRDAFMAMLTRDINRLVNKAAREGMIPCVRPNGTSSINWDRKLGSSRVNIFKMYENIQFYDYSEQIKQMRKYLRGDMPNNYHLTFSRKENNWDECEEVLTSGGNVAAVFGVLKGESLPNQYMGYKVIDADKDDLRFLDPTGVICGLRPKGRRQALERDRLLLSGMAIAV